MKSKIQFYWLLTLIPLAFIVWFFVAKSHAKPLRSLAFYGPKYIDQKNDSVYHTIEPFEFINQYNERITLDSMKGKVFISEFFFTTCKSICPIMNLNLQKVHQQFSNRNDFRILSHTVDPEEDSVSVLKDYANRQGVFDRSWFFLTGTKKELYQMARTSYLLNAEEGDGGSEDFIHTQNFALVDKERRIRGYYDGTDTVEINRLITELSLLFAEYDYQSAISN